MNSGFLALAGPKDRHVTIPLLCNGNTRFVIGITNPIDSGVATKVKTEFKIVTTTYPPPSPPLFWYIKTGHTGGNNITVGAASSKPVYAVNANSDTSLDAGTGFQVAVEVNGAAVDLTGMWGCQLKITATSEEGRGFIIASGGSTDQTFVINGGRPF